MRRTPWHLPPTCLTTSSLSSLPCVERFTYMPATRTCLQLVHACNSNMLATKATHHCLLHLQQRDQVRQAAKGGGCHHHLAKLSSANGKPTRKRTCRAAGRCGCARTHSRVELKSHFRWQGRSKQPCSYRALCQTNETSVAQG